jgi:hypothetical protein
MRTLTAGMILTIVLAGTSPARGYEGSGGIDLDPRPSVRAVAMGETGVVGTGTAGCFAANPSTPAWLPSTGITLTHRDLVEGVSASVTSVSAGVPFGSEVTMPDAGTVGRRFGIGFGMDHGGVELSQGTDWGWNLVSAGAAYRFAPYVSAGLTGKYFFSNSDLEDSGVQAYGLDLGARLELSPALALAVSLKNLAGSVRWDDGADESPPFAADLGAGFLLPYGPEGRLVLGLSGSEPARLGMGLEVPVAGTGLSMRSGYIYHTGDYSRGIITAGFGYAYSGFGIDYALKLDDDLVLGTTHHFSLGYMFP